MREVRVSNSFFDDVDDLFPPERGVDGRASADDIVRYVVPSPIAEIGERYERRSGHTRYPGVKAFFLPAILPARRRRVRRRGPEAILPSTFRAFDE